MEFSAICTQESYISDDDDLTLLEIEGYKLIRQGRSCSKNGGLIIYLHEKFDFEHKLKLNKYKTWEGQFIQIKKGEVLDRPIIIGKYIAL
jgi:hypothetical protein